MSYKIYIKFFVLLSFNFIIGSEEVDHANYTSSEKEALTKLRPIIENLVHHDYQKQDAFLIGFLRAKNLNIDQAKEMISKSMEWRKQNSIDTITSEKEMYELMKQLPVSLGEAFDKKGRPALQVSFGPWNIRKFMIAGQRALISRYQTFGYETMVTKARKLGKSQWIFLVDMNGYNLRQHACLACLPFFSDLVITYENNYPNTARHTLLVNTPRIFEGVLQLIRPIMSPITRRDLQVFGTNKEEWQRVVLEIFPPEQLTSMYGGTKSA